MQLFTHWQWWSHPSTQLSHCCRCSKLHCEYHGITYHFTVTRPRRAIGFARRAIFDAYAVVYKLLSMFTTKWVDTHLSLRTLRSRGNGCLSTPSKGEFTGKGGSGSKLRGKMPGSRQAFNFIQRVCSTQKTLITNRSQHTRHSQQGHVSSHCCNSGAFIMPIPYTCCAEPHARKTTYKCKGRNKSPRRIATCKQTTTAEKSVARWMSLVIPLQRHDGHRR